jgi:hypothetical protein
MDRQYRRELTPDQKESLRVKYRDYLQYSRGGFLTTNKRKRLLEIKKGDEGTPEADFWYKLKQSARDSIVDLQMICDIADNEQIKEIFQRIPIKKIEKNVPIKNEDFVSLPRLISSVLVTNWRSEKKDDLWKALLVKELINACLNYIETSGILMTKAHMRLIDEIRDLVNAVIGVAIELPPDRRRGYVF